MAVGAGAVDSGGRVIAARIVAQVIVTVGGQAAVRVGGSLGDRTGFGATGGGIGDGDENEHGEQRGDERQQPSKPCSAPVHVPL